MKRTLLLLISVLLAGNPSSALAKKYQLVAGAGPSTKIVQRFFDEFSQLPQSAGYVFKVPRKSDKHAGGITCSHYNFFGRTGRPLNTDERQQNKAEIFLAKVPIAFVAGNRVGIETLSLNELERVLTGEISNWKELGGTDAEIVLIGREPTEALFLEIKKSYPLFSIARFDAIVHKDDHVINFIRSPQGRYGLGFGARPNFKGLHVLSVPGFSAGVRLGLVYDLKHRKNPIIESVKEYARSPAWRAIVTRMGLQPAD